MDIKHEREFVDIKIYKMKFYVFSGMKFEWDRY